MSRSPSIGGLILALLGVLTLPCPARAADITTPTPLLNDPVAGQTLAADVRDARPAGPADWHGLLKIRRRDGSTTNVPIVSQMILADKTWQSLYQAGPTNRIETLIVIHTVGATNEYRYGPPGSAPQPLPLEKIWQPLAGSDFWLGDLGLEFFHWPTQKLVQDEMRKGRACHVLESRPAALSGYSRVLSWVDVETHGLIMAEAYDAKGEIVKEFEVKGFKKVNDQWQLQEMEIRRPLNKTRTLLQFDVPEP